MADQAVEPKPKAKRGPNGHFLKGADNPRVVSPDRSGIQLGGKHTKTKIKDMVLNALDAVGGQAYLETLARSRKDKHLFVQMVLKAMPNEVTGKDGGPIDMNLLAIARVGVSNLNDEQLDQLFTLFKQMGVGDVLQSMGAANDSPPDVPALEGEVAR